jgi:hypothetical protein
VRGRSLWFPVFAVIVGSLVPLVSDAQPRTDAPLLTTIQAIRSLSQDQSERAYPVRVRGIVTHIDEAAGFSLFIHDGELGQFVARPTHPAALAAYRELKRGDLVEVVPLRSKRALRRRRHRRGADRDGAGPAGQTGNRGRRCRVPAVTPGKPILSNAIFRVA